MHDLLFQPAKEPFDRAVLLLEVVGHEAAAMGTDPALWLGDSADGPLRRGDQDENPASYVDGLVGKTFFVLNKLVGSGHMSGLPVRCI